MAYIDRTTGQVVVRVVYDGIPEAGKTTNIQKLCKSIGVDRRSEVSSPGSEGRATEFFDWMDFLGGYFDGRRLRVQLVTVPGQERYRNRRRYLMREADTVIFVADSRASAMAANNTALASLREIVGGFSPTEIGLVVQANKQDLPGALGVEEVVAQLGLAAATPSVVAQADVGRGVMQTFMVAVRVASDKLRAMLLAGTLKEGPVGKASPDELYAILREVEESLEDLTTADEPAAAAPTMPPTAPVTHGAPAGSDDPAAPAIDPPAGASMGNPFSDGIRALRVEDVPASHMWPAPTARRVFAELVAAQPANGRGRRWHPQAGTELVVEGSGYLYSHPSWSFPSVRAAQDHLRRLARRHQAIIDFVPEQRCFAILPQEGGWRMWMTSPDTHSLHDTLLDALDHQEDDALLQAVSDIGLAARTVQEQPWLHEEGMPLALGSVYIAEGRVRCLSLPEEQPQGETVPDLLGEMRTTLRKALTESPPRHERLKRVIAQLRSQRTAAS